MAKKTFLLRKILFIFAILIVAYIGLDLGFKGFFTKSICNLIESKLGIIKPHATKVKYSKKDSNLNAIPDAIDLVNSARKEVTKKTVYKDAYYANGYPPDSEGVCTDVIWRAFKGIGVDLKALVDKDIKENTSLYPRVSGKPDASIDFRRVPNLNVFFKRHCESLPTEFKPNDRDNLNTWQPGDIVVFLKPYEHIGIISDKVTFDDMPLFIHNTPPHASEVPYFYKWTAEIAGHYRWKY